MEGTVISDAVNLASRVEGMTKMYGARILITENTFSQLKTPEDYIIRRADRARVKGKEQPITVYEVCAGDEPDVKAKKKKIIPIFEKALDAYYSQDFKSAIKGFQSCLEVCSDDKISDIYVKRAHELLSNSPGEKWDGVVTLSSK